MRLGANQLLQPTMHHHKMVHHLLVRVAVGLALWTDTFPFVRLQMAEQMQSEVIIRVVAFLDADAAGLDGGDSLLLLQFLLGLEDFYLFVSSFFVRRIKRHFFGSIYHVITSLPCLPSLARESFCIT